MRVYAALRETGPGNYARRIIMNLSPVERLIVNNPLRAFIQRHGEGPMLRKMGDREKYPVCLEIGCGRGAGARVIAEQFGAKKVIATDIDPKQIERAKKTVKTEYKGVIEFKVEDAGVAGGTGQYIRCRFFVRGDSPPGGLEEGYKRGCKSFKTRRRVFFRGASQASPQKCLHAIVRAPSPRGRV